MLKVAINGFGRIGRAAFKVWFDKYWKNPSTRSVNSGQASSGQVQVVAINDLVEAKILAHLLKFDSVYGLWERDIGSENVVRNRNADESEQVGKIFVEGFEVATYAARDPNNLPWRDLDVDVVIESTGRFTDAQAASAHLSAGAKKVVISAPGSQTPTFLIGVNEDKYKGEEIINNASCTTNCIAPVAKIMHQTFGIKKAMMTTVHAVTAEQNLVDGPPLGGKAGDLRRARAGYINIIPTTTGAAISTTEAIPELKGLFDGMALRVPVAVGSISDFTFLLSKPVTVEEVNQVIEKAAADATFSGILAVTRDPIVSSDIVGRSESAIVDLSLTQVVDGDLVKVFAWYDNEWGYSNRLIEQVIQVGKHP